MRRYPPAGPTTPYPAPATGWAPPAAPARCASSPPAATCCSPSGGGRGWPPCTPRPNETRGDSFRPDWRITDLIRHAAHCEAPDPGIVCPDDGPDFTALQTQVRQALRREPRKKPELARRAGRALCDGCTAPH